MHTESTNLRPGEGQDLFCLKPVAVQGGKPLAAGSASTARVVMPNRTQIELRPMHLESLLAEGHRARLVWAWVERQDLSAMYAAIKVRQGGVGRSAIAPQILMGLWLYAALQGVGGARQLSRLVLENDAHRWMSGGVQVSTIGSDMAQLAPMVEQIEQRLGSAPRKMLVDGGFPAHAQIDAVAGRTEVYAPSVG